MSKLNLNLKNCGKRNSLNVRRSLLGSSLTLVEFHFLQVKDSFIIQSILEPTLQSCCEDENCFYQVLKCKFGTQSALNKRVGVSVANFSKPGEGEEML